MEILNETYYYTEDIQLLYEKLRVSAYQARVLRGDHRPLRAWPETLHITYYNPSPAWSTRTAKIRREYTLHPRLAIVRRNKLLLDSPLEQLARAAE